MSVICRTFVQNAWRSDLCSNCFKSLEDHSDHGTARRNNVCEKLAMPRYVPQAASLYQSRGISTSLKWRLNDSLYDKVSRRDFASQTPQSTNKMSHQDPPPPGGNNRGILVKTDSNSSEKKYKSRPSVDFSAEEALVIGYGGNDYDSDTSPWEMGSDDGSIDFDLLDDTDEDRKITRLTKNNTEFNSFNKNLLSGDGSRKEEEKLNAINNNNNNNNNSNPVKSTDKSISILTYNDIQSTKTEKKLNQYFFPSSTEIKSYLNGHGKSLVLEEAVLKNNNDEKPLVAHSVKVQNCKRDNNASSNKIDDFTPLNTRTYSFVSELNKSNVSFEQSSDSDYSTCRHTTGDSTDSESFHDVEESRSLPKSSFLHGTYALSTPRLNEMDIDKKYDAGSSTSGDVSNLSDDSDTHDTTDRTPYKLRSTRVPAASAESKQGKEDEQKVDLYRKEETAVPQQQEDLNTHVNTKDHNNIQQNSQKETSPKTDSKQSHQTKSSPKSKQSLSSAMQNKSSTVTIREDNCDNLQTDTNHQISKKIPVSDSKKNSPKNSPKDNVTAKLGSKSTSMPNMLPPPDVIEVKRNPVPKSKDTSVVDTKSATKPAKYESVHTSSCSNLQNSPPSEIEAKPLHSMKVPEDNLTENGDKEQILTDKEFKDYEDQSDYEKSPEAINNRQSKLAALALELELARRDSEAKANKPPCPPAPVSPPEVKARLSVQGTPASSPPENFSTIKKASAISCASRLSTLPDVLQETPAKQKKTKFSLKKLLKRNKDSGTFSPSSKEAANPKAWKKQTFDRNRLSLEIVHPMDLTSEDLPTSCDSTPTEEHKMIVSTHPGKFMFKGVSSRARSLSALPQLSGDDQSGIALLECRRMDTVPVRKAGTVAERKKNRPALVRTPSCSALPNRTTTSAGSSPTQGERVPPPKPPPPPKCKAMHPPPPPPPPHSHPRSAAKASSNTSSPARPPPPKVPESKSRSHCSGSSAQELHEQNHSDKEYANLGDIRSLLTPKKPQRPSAFSATPREGEIGPLRTTKGEDVYETLPVMPEEEEEDHYTYLDDAEVKSSKQTEVKKSPGTTIPTKTKPAAEPVSCGRPWLDLQTSYAAIAAANYESLAELITTSLNESTEYFKNLEHCLKWRDFSLESEDQYQIIQEKAIYNAVYKNEDKVTLVVAPRKLTTPQNARNQTRYPVLAAFSDHVPRNFVSADNYILQGSEAASVYVLQHRSRITTVGDFAKASSADPAASHQSVHLRDYCFVLLQLIHTLKGLQAEGVEEIPYDHLQVLVLVVTDEEKPPVLVLFPEDKAHLTLSSSDNRRTLCQATLDTLLHFLRVEQARDLRACTVNGERLPEPVAHTFQAIAGVLSEEKASSLSQAKGFLEYMLWGPVDVSRDSEDAILQRWLDLQRAQMVRSTVSHLQRRTRSPLHVYEEYQLIFLLQASVKSLKGVISKL